MTCERCDGSGYVYREVEDGRYTVMQQFYCMCAVGVIARYPGIPVESVGWRFDNWPGPAGIREEVRRAVQSKRWIVLTGPYGTGKTSLAVSAMRFAVDNCTQSRFWNTAALLDTTKATFGNEDKANPIERLHSRPAFLVLDGMGERPLTEWERGALMTLLGQRYTKRLQTVITTNWALPEIGKYLGGWIADRLRDVGAVITVDGQSMRGRPAA